MIYCGRLGDPVPEGTRRVLVDRLWPRGVSKADPPFDEWVKSVAPSDGLRRWYGHDPDRYEEFRRRYWAELESMRYTADMEHLLALARSGHLALLTYTKVVEQSQVPVLCEFLTRALGEDATRP
ncbi:MAG: DUF488 family protein [Firmicutes bacterium]|nr:DUF488 family protein [Bacillota bacterium]